MVLNGDIKPMVKSMYLQSLKSTSPNIINQVQEAVSSFYFILDEIMYYGSGSFISLSNSDLKDGIFMTASHCVMNIINDSVIKITEAYVVNPVTKQWVQIINNNSSNIYYDGTADIAIIKTNIDLTNYPYVLHLADNNVNIGEFVSLHGNPAGFDHNSVAVGNVRDNHWIDMEGFKIPDSIFVTNAGVGGNSGGPIVNNMGKIVGIYTFGY